MQLSKYASWDEDFYLKDNPDIANAIKEGNIVNGFHHWINHGALERRRDRIKQSPSFEGEKIVVVTSIFDRDPEKKLYRNYALFRESLGDVRLITVELLFEDQEPLIADSIKIYADSESQCLWQKEALLNLGAKEVPDDIPYIAYLDCDILLPSNWKEKTLEKLEEYSYVQMFSEVNYQGKDGHIEETKKGSVRTLLLDKDSFGLSNPGMAWAFHKKILPEGLFPYSFQGGGDTWMSYLLFGQSYRDLSLWLYRHTHPSIILKAHDWIKTVSPTRGEPGYVDQTLIHLYHGPLKERKYVERLDWANQANLDIDDIILGENGCLTTSNKTLINFMKNHFLERSASTGSVSSSKSSSFIDSEKTINQHGRTPWIKNSPFRRISSVVNGEEIDIPFSQEMAVLSVFFDLSQKELFKRNIEIFRSQFSTVRLTLIELIYEGCPPVFEESFKIYLNKEHLAWQKECALNYVIKRLPDHIKYVSWIDGDVILPSSWYEETLKALEKYNYVQLWEKACFLGENFSIERENTSLAYIHCNDMNNLKIQPHPGFAWAARLDSLPNLLFDWGFTGTSDTWMADTFSRNSNPELENFLFKLPPKLVYEGLHWRMSIPMEKRNNLGYLPLGIYHLYHGDFYKRQYSERILWAKEVGYDINTLEKDERGFLVIHSEAYQQRFLEYYKA